MLVMPEKVYMLAMRIAMLVFAVEVQATPKKRKGITLIRRKKRDTGCLEAG